MANVYVQEEKYFVWDDGNYEHVDTHSCYLPVTVLKAGNRTPSKNTLGMAPGLRKFTEQEGVAQE